MENHNKTLKDQLHTMISTLTQDDWDIYLPTVQFMYNTTVSSATGYTPMLLMTGREARLPSFNHMRGVDVEMTGELMGNKFVQRMIETMRGYHDLALEHAGKNYGRMNVRVRKPLKFVDYKPGDKFVRVKRPMTSFKSAGEEEAHKICTCNSR